MTFEEFFAKKKIDLAALGKAEPALLSEFKTHYGQMGEKSFDHTKKYWFNKLRLQYHLAAQQKEEKVIIENQLAEQTIADTLSETTAPSPNVGFKPRFKAGMAKPVEQQEELKPGPEQKPAESTEPASPASVPGFKPRFKAGITKPAEPPIPTESTPVTEPEKSAKSAEQPGPAPALGFKPKFKAGITKTVTDPHAPKEEEGSEAEKPAESTEQTAAAPALGFKPKFKAGVTKSVQTPTEPKAESKPETPAEDKPAESNEAKPANLGFKPRFNAKPKGE